jgi:diguanylate cyclase (GGDEF)-like protein/PAS domain S-box-containing protein
VRTKTLLIACTVLLLLMIGAFEVSRRVLAGSLAAIESETARQSLQRVSNALQADLRQIAISASDYAHWDDTYDFALGRDPAFAALTFSAASLATIQVDVVWIIDTAGKDLFGLRRDPGSSGAAQPLHPELLSRLRRHAPQIAAPGPAPAARLLRVPGGGVLAFSAAPILRNDLSGPSAGALMFGRLLTAEDFTRIEQTSQLPVRAVFLDERGGTTVQLPGDVRAWFDGAARGTGPGTYVSAPASADAIDAYELLRDIEQRPVLLLSTSVDRDVLRLGERTIRSVLATLLAGFAVILLAMLAVLHRSWRAREAIEYRYGTVTSQINECILLADPATGALVDANEALARTLGYAKPELLALRLHEIFVEPPPAQLPGARAPVESRELTLRGKDNARVPVEVTATAFHLERRALLCLVARDITARKEAERQQRLHQMRLSHVGLHDTLTRLPNRLHLRSRLPQLAAQADRDGSRLALFYIDLDHFKDINDSLGHGNGDQLLVSVAQRLRSSMASHDLVARMGGDEFVVIATGLRHMDAAESIAQRIRDTLSKPFDINGSMRSVAMSMGIAIYPDHGSDLEQLLKHADIALYQAKERGRGTHQFFSPEIGSRREERLSLVQALRSAIGTEQIFLEYQPAFDMHSETPVSLEALLRWKHPELGLISPARFIPLAEQTGLIQELGHWVIRRVCQQLAIWKVRRVPLVPVSINVSARQFEHALDAERVAELAREFGIDVRLLHFEITESVVVHNSEQHLGVLQALRDLGSKILIDDFGTGYSSLSYLKNLPIDTLKIDRSFVRDLPHDDYDVAIVRGVVGIARSLGLQLVVEGVETAEQLACLRELGCTIAQGFYFSRPLAAEPCRQLLERPVLRRRAPDQQRLSEKRTRRLRSPGSAA